MYVRSMPYSPFLMDISPQTKVQDSRHLLNSLNAYLTDYWFHSFCVCIVDRMPPFTGTCICVTGSAINQDKRAEIKELVERCGGKFQAHLDSNVTHLIATERAGDKYEWARKNPSRVQIVNLDVSDTRATCSTQLWGSVCNYSTFEC